jgi:hypothetical protein
MLVVEEGMVWGNAWLVCGSSAYCECGKKPQRLHLYAVVGIVVALVGKERRCVEPSGPHYHVDLFPFSSDDLRHELDKFYALIAVLLSPKLR